MSNYSWNEISEVSKEKDITQAQQKHHIWECSSLQDIKNIRELKFNIYKTGINNKVGPKDGTIENVNNSYVMNFNEDLAKYVLLLEKLMIYMHKQNIKEFALSSGDRIFELVSIDYFKRM